MLSPSKLGGRTWQGSKNSQLNSVLIWIKGQNMSVHERHENRLELTASLWTQLHSRANWSFLTLFVTVQQPRNSVPPPRKQQNKQKTHLNLLNQNQCMMERISAVQMSPLCFRLNSFTAKYSLNGLSCYLHVRRRKLLFFLICSVTFLQFLHQSL